MRLGRTGSQASSQNILFEILRKADINPVGTMDMGERLSADAELNAGGSCDPDKGICSYQVLWNTFKQIAAGYSADEKAALFSGAAAKAYRLTL